MSRPKKYRHALDDLQQPHVARQLAAFVLDIEERRTAIAEMQAGIAEVYDDADGEGFDKAVIRKLVSLRAKDPVKVERDEQALAAYEAALEAGRAAEKPRVHVHAREENESRAKAGREAKAGPRPKAPGALEERPVQTARVEPVSRPAGGRTPAATSEIKDVTARRDEHPQFTPPKPMPALPPFLDRRPDHARTP